MRFTPNTPLLISETMTDIVFYNYTGRNNVVNKSLTGGVSLQGHLQSEFSVLRPVVTIKSETPIAYNYAYISALNRFYFVETNAFVGNGKYRLQLAVDVLKTYAVEIFNATGTITRKDGANAYLSTTENVYDIRPNVEKVEFASDLFTQQGSIIMITIKGNEQ